VTTVAALILIFFHGISKCMLFLNAGILEKVFHYKQTSGMDKLAETGPLSSLVITVGFMSLLLPPFGAFIGKWFSIETLANGQKITGAWALTAIAVGGAILSLLYFKVLGLLIVRSGERDKFKPEKMNPVYAGTMYLLMGLILLTVVCFPFLMTGFFVPIASQTLQLPLAVTMVGWNMHIGTITLPIIPLLAAFVFLPLTLILARFIKFKNVDRVKEYSCGEKTDYAFSSFYFSTDNAVPYFYTIGIAAFMLLILVAIW
jgi:ech hydrogenase subunit A